MHARSAPPLAVFASISLFSLACLPGIDERLEPTSTPRVEVAAARTVTTVAPTGTPTPLPVLPTLRTYIVKSGDYPTLIAEEAGVPADFQEAWIAEMLSLNGVEATALQIGQELILPPVVNGPPSLVAQATSRAGNPPAGVLEPQEPAGTPTPKPTQHVGPPPFAATPPFVGNLSPTATPTPGATTPDPTAVQGNRAWLTSSDEAALYYYCDLDSGWTNIPSDKLLAFDSEQELLAIWGRFRDKAPDSVC